jgi:hypothetical protein
LLSGFAIALVAAAIGDPLVETISDTGIFGRGFIDDNHQSVVTVMTAGIVLGLLLVIARFRLVARNVGDSRDWLREIGAALAKTSSSRHVAPIFAVQLAVVFAMESGEQLLGRGVSIHGLSWLGAPPIVSLALHLAVCLICAYAARRVTRAVVPRVLAVICEALDRILAALALDAVRGVLAHSPERLVRRFDFHAARRIRGRAPPSLAALPSQL